MSRDHYSTLAAFIAVVREGGFTRGAAKLGVSQSALSHSIRTLETNLGVRLLTRTSRKVSLTNAGERLFHSIAAQMDVIDDEVRAVSELRDKPSGFIRLTATDTVIKGFLIPKLTSFLSQYPDISIELIRDYRQTDLAAERHDGGVRAWEQIDKDMIAVPIGPAMNLTVVGSPEYFRKHPKPETPHDLLAHNCIHLRLPGRGDVYPWEFLGKDGKKFKVESKGQLIVHGSYDKLEATLASIGVAYMPVHLVAPHIATGALVSVLDEWCPSLAGYYLYYPSRRHPTRAMELFIEACRYQHP